MPQDSFISGIADSKTLSEKKREYLYGEIVKRAVCWNVGVANVEEIERLNILNAARLAFQRAVAGLAAPFLLYTDYITGLDLAINYVPVIKGDAKVYSIAAASILAKVTRDRLMREYDTIYPEYGFSRHKGYGTQEHMRAILEYGPCSIHRPSFLKGILHEKK
jgi:ribonuclease HII